MTFIHVALDILLHEWLLPASMAASSFAIPMLYSCAIKFCVIYFILLCPLSLTASQDAIDLSSKCPHLLTTANIKHKPPNDGSLLVVVPWKVGFEQFVKFTPDSCSLDGFSVRVFREAVLRMQPRPPRFDFVLHGNGTLSPAYDDMIDMVARGEVDAVVADLTITSERMGKVGFSMPYLASSLVILTPFRHDSEGALWDFLKPFSMPLWFALLGCFLVTGLALYLLENHNPDFLTTTSPCKKHHDAESSSHGASEPAHAPPHDSSPGSELVDVSTPPPPIDPCSLQHPGSSIYQASHKHRIMNAYWFTSLCIFAAQEESVRTHLGRFVTVMWLFVMLITYSGYTASLASLISTQGGHPTIDGFQALLQDISISVGYQEGSFMTSYMKKIHMDNHRLRSFTTERDYKEALKLHWVGAVLDELPYIQIVLQSDCDLTQSSDDDSLPSFGGFGFAFHKNSSLIEEVSKMIVGMEEDGSLHNLTQLYGIGVGKKDHTCSEKFSHLRLRSFGGLFSILAGVYACCILVRLMDKAIKSKQWSSLIKG